MWEAAARLALHQGYGFAGRVGVALAQVRAVTAEQGRALRLGGNGWESGSGQPHKAGCSKGAEKQERADPGGQPVPTLRADGEPLHGRRLPLALEREQVDARREPAHVEHGRAATRRYGLRLHPPPGQVGEREL